MSEDRRGQIITFYSYKGGTGRTMALANVAWILAAAGNRVLVADWDLEAPGLDRFFAPFLDGGTTANCGGVIDLIREAEDRLMAGLRPDGYDPQELRRTIDKLARVNTHTFSVNWEFGNGGSLSMLPAGRQNGAYASALSSLNWDNFYDRLGGADFLDALGRDMRCNYDYTLLDSRTGFSDVADICTQHLPDTLIACYTLSNQGIEGAARLARAVEKYAKNRHGAIRILPIAMRVDLAEKGKAEAGRRLAMRAFEGLPGGMAAEERSRFFSTYEVPYQAYYAYEEMLAIFGDAPNTPASLLAAYERLTALITNGAVSSFAPMEESQRVRWRNRFERSAPNQQSEVVLQYAPEDQVWSEWAESVLTAAGVAVVDPGPLAKISPLSASGVSAVLTILSKSYLAVQSDPDSDPLGAAPAHMVMYVNDVRPRNMQHHESITVVGQAENVAAQRLLRMAGFVGDEYDGREPHGVRFPGDQPRWFKAPARFARFTGRTDDLQSLRTALLHEGEAVVLPVTLQGMGGIGKTQLALEYVYRFRTAYDLVWWIQADPPQFVDTALTDLGNEIGLAVESSENTPGSAAALFTIDALRRGTPARRWLLVFDNADDLRQIERFLPRGDLGHLLITSRNPEWGSSTHSIHVDVFKRNESIEHLRRRVPTMTLAEADQVADALGDLPLAVEAAAAWLAETGTTVETYLHRVEKEGADPEYSQKTTWDMSLERLRSQTPGAYRLLEVCSVLAPEVATDLVHSAQMARTVEPFDPAVRDRLMLGAVVQQVNRLALLKLDTQARQVQVHRLVQNAVRSQMTPDELAATRHEAHLVLASFRPTGEADDPRTWPQFRMIWPHLATSGAEACGDDSVRQLMVDRVRYLWRRGDLAAAEALGRRISESWKNLLDADVSSAAGDAVPAAEKVDRDSLRRKLLLLQFNIAIVLRSASKYEEALLLNEEVLTAQRELLGDRHANTLMTASSRAADLRALGRYREALAEDERTYAAWRQGFGDENPRTLASANNLAVSLRAVGDFRRARTVDEELLGLRRQVLGEDDQYTLFSMTSLARDLREAGEYGQSVRLLREALDLARMHLGAESVTTLRAQTNLAVSLRCGGRTDESAALVDEAYSILLDRFGPENPDTLACRLNRATSLLSVGNVAEALAETMEVAKAYQATLGVDHPFTLVCASNESAAHRILKDRRKGLEMAEHAAAGCQRLLGERHPYSLATATNLAACRSEAGDPGAASAQASQLVGLMTDTLGPHHPDTLICRANADILRGRSQDSTAIAELVQQLGAEHPSVSTLRTGQLLYRVLDPYDPF
jgi:tetratricopeptide (TPR) repeat protein